MPSDSTGYAYLLVSLAPGTQGKVTYIGQTTNLIARFEKHKRGAGPAAIANINLRPWALLAYVSCFEGVTETGRMYFERLWQAARDIESQF